MIKTRTRSMMHEDLTEAMIVVVNRNNNMEFRFRNIISIDEISEEDTKIIEEDLDDEECDPKHHYLRLNYKNGSQATFNNSEVDLFII